MKLIISLHVQLHMIYIMDHMHSKFKFHKFNLLKKLVIQHESKFDFREVREFKSSLPIWYILSWMEPKCYFRLVAPCRKSPCKPIQTIRSPLIKCHMRSNLFNSLKAKMHGADCRWREESSGLTPFIIILVVQSHIFYVEWMKGRVLL